MVPLPESSRENGWCHRVQNGDSGTQTRDNFEVQSPLIALGPWGRGAGRHDCSQSDDKFLKATIKLTGDLAPSDMPA